MRKMIIRCISIIFIFASCPFVYASNLGVIEVRVYNHTSGLLRIVSSWDKETGSYWDTPNNIWDESIKSTWVTRNVVNTRDLCFYFGTRDVITQASVQFFLNGVQSQVLYIHDKVSCNEGGAKNLIANLVPAQGLCSIKNQFFHDLPRDRYYTVTIDCKEK